jgi:hypothetical protein
MPQNEFNPITHGFAFGNSWSLNQEEKDAIRRWFSMAIDVASIGMSLFFVAPLKRPASRLLREELNNWIDNAEPFGLCGGMAFAALDYYHHLDDGIVFPRGTDRKNYPPRKPDKGWGLRAYLQDRLVDSLALNGLTFLTWMAILHYAPNGAKWLGRESKRHWKRLQDRIDTHGAWPIGLVGDTKDPTHNHQVVAYKWEKTGDDAGIISVYDMNCPRMSTIDIVFEDEGLRAVETCRSEGRGSLRGFFCERYTTKMPPIVEWPQRVNHAK